jgi:hypothetical protein
VFDVTRAPPQLHHFKAKHVSVEPLDNTACKPRSMALKLTRSSWILKNGCGYFRVPQYERKS